MYDTELYGPNMYEKETKQGYIYVENSGIRPVTYTVCDGLAVYEGDIILGTLETMSRMNELMAGRGAECLPEDEAVEAEMIARACAISTVGKWWPKSTIPYEFGDAQNVSAINQAIDYVTRYTPIKLISHGSERNFISFAHSAGCSSYVGMQGGKQAIWIANWAERGNVVHEIFHAAGLWHEQSRSDRDKYVTINYGNIDPPTAANNFNQHISDGVELSKYDYGSIMHYSETAFAKVGTKTIVPKKSGVIIGQRDNASEGDKQALVYMYAKS